MARSRACEEIFDLILAMKDMNARYHSILEKMLASSFRPEKLTADIDAIAKVIRPAIAEDKHLRVEAFERALAERQQATPSAARSDDANPNRENRPPDLGGSFGPGLGRQKAPLKQFVARRAESIRAQLAGKEEGYVPVRRNFGRGPGMPGEGPGALLALPLIRMSDANHDEKLSLAEFKTAFDQWFEQWDTDQSGSLDLQKVVTGLRKVIPPPPDFGGPQRPGETRPPRPNANAGPEDRPHEFSDPPEGGLGRRLGHGGPGAGPFGGPIGAFARQMLRSADANDDRLLSRDELTQACAKWFAAWDLDKHGTLDSKKLTEGFNQLFGPPP